MSAWAAVAYLPVPGWQVVPVLAAPTARLVRYHAWQAAALVVLLWLTVVAVGLAMLAAPGAGLVVGAVGGLVVLVGAVALLVGAVAAARGRYLRIPVAWHVLAAMKR